MRIARGIQNKVLEAMAMAKPVVVTSMGLEGIDARDPEEVVVADDAAGFVDRLAEVFSGQINGLGQQARQRVCMAYTWENTLPNVDQWLK
jgi:glycosyltransferase involved in cell wall biosynthesis